LKHTSILKTALVIFGLLVLAASSANAQSAFYIRAGAGGANNGSDWNNAFTSIPSNLQRGATYYVASGTYPGYTFQTPASGSTRITIKKATAGDHGTSTGWQSSYGTGPATFTNSLRFITPYWVIDGVVGGGPTSWKSGHGFRIHAGPNPCVSINPGFSGNAHNITVNHTEMRGNGGNHAGEDGIFAVRTNDLHFSHNWIYDVGNCPYQYNSAVRVVMQYSYIGNYHSEAAFHAQIASVDYSEEITFRWNVFTHVEGTGGLTLDSTNRGGGFYIYGNVFYQDNHAGAWYGNNGVIGGWSASVGSRIKVFNNTFINVPANVPVMGWGGAWSGNEVKNNLFYSVGQVGTLPSSVTSHNHHVDTTATGSSPSTGSGNPFVTLDVTNSNFAKLTGGTTAGDSGVSSIYRTDWFGNVGTTRGAIQFGQDTTQPPAAPSNLRTAASN
jgi:hypothetical protein